jgi:imidazolonepropionase-like amidohydrolase
MNARPARLAILVAALAAYAPGAHSAVPVPGAPQARAVALVGGTVHPVSGPAIENGTVVFDRGHVVALGRGIEVPSGAERIDVSGKHVYPGLVDPYSVLGLTEIDATRQSSDFTEVGDIAPNVQAQVAFHPESESLPVARSNGVLTALVAPRGTLLRGRSALMMLDGWTWEDMTLRAPVALHVAWPSMVIPIGGTGTKDAEDRARETRDRALERLQSAFDEARAYWTAARAKDAADHGHDARWAAMMPLFDGKMPLIVEAEEIQQIEAAVAFAAREKVRLVIYGGYDAPQAAALLKKYDVPVIVGAIYRLPARRHEAYDEPFTVPERLRQAGVRFCIANGGGHWNERNLPYQAGTASAYGLPREEALRAVTLYPAEILGVADRIGSLAPGKDATLFVADGDILEIPTRVERAWIQGRAVDLGDKQKVLWQKYAEKHRRFEAGGGAGGAND